MNQTPVTPVLDRVRLPADMKALSDRELRLLADELRAETISAVSVTGGHLGAGLGVVELTVALHAVFDAPRDKIIWDVGHQCYPHKILTGRRDRIRTLRMEGGLSGFTKRSESPYDPFGAAHSSTSISAALGFAAHLLGRFAPGTILWCRQPMGTFDAPPYAPTLSAWFDPARRRHEELAAELLEEGHEGLQVGGRVHGAPPTARWSASRPRSTRRSPGGAGP